MITYYVLDGENRVYNYKDELKTIKPNRKDFKKWWIWNKEFKCWQLEVPNSINSKKFETELKEFCEVNSLKFEKLEFTPKLTKSRSEFKSNDEFFQYFHAHNQRPRL